MKSLSPDFRIRFSELLRRSRQDAQLSIRELARRVGTDPTHLSRMERGFVRVPTGPLLTAIIRELPNSALAAGIRDWISRALKAAVKESADRTLQLLRGLSAEDVADSAWNFSVATVLKNCLRSMRSKDKRE